MAIFRYCGSMVTVRDPPTLLVVDDEKSILGVMARFAEELGFTVVTCSGGAQAIEQLKHHRADVAAVDLRMPDVGGLEVLRAIRDEDSDCQVILMSGHMDADFTDTHPHCGEE